MDLSEFTSFGTANELQANWPTPLCRKPVPEEDLYAHLYGSLALATMYSYHCP